VLLRFYDVTSGEILINSKNIESYTIDSLRKAFSVMFQNYTAYALTLRENIQLSDLDKANWSDQDALKALDIVNAENLLHKLKFGLDTHIYRIFSKDGYEPSGGENQKIALARAVNRHCYALILDEPSASLDPESEYKLYNNLRNEFADKMIIFTSHRLFAARLADKIIMLDNGRIIEQGTHDELMKLNKEYARLYNLQ
jgi:ABC-type multidrug transport system fused ATPase/permease subunit